ncbi:hypothetical protein [Clavibacter sp. VKM Ac-2872]|uniref:hypothetical protein n=1 Tax=Clavibacter sp. VKM Ac-2872 TaxID=2783812 RepID=UPI00188A3F29|nr:hypothetical protein [Clavibacter sp. VKM Ac-2872]MBF4622729.1 hypothetical protein [Clavibacter sp. VKM Ac-2872]
MTIQHRAPRGPALAGTAIAALIALTACTGSPAGPDPTPVGETPAATAEPQATPADTERFASLDDFISRQHASWEHAGEFTGTAGSLAAVAREGTAPSAIAAGSAGTIDVTLPAPKDPGADAVVITADCTGTEPYWVRVVQENPNRVGAKCGTDGRGLMSVPLDDPTVPTELEITIPEGTRIWLATYYAAG